MAEYFPSHADSVQEWLELIKMPQYSSHMEKVVSTGALKRMKTDDLAALGIANPGHRKRILKAAANLATDPEEMEVEGKIDTELESVEVKPKYNTTSSLYIHSTITAPDSEEVIFCASLVLHDWIREGEQSDQEENLVFSYFNEENSPIYQAQGENSRQTSKRRKREIPSEDTIFQTMRAIHWCAQFSVECFVVALIYLERLVALTKVPVKVNNWRPLVLAALLVAQKVWDDRCLKNVDFTVFCPMFTLKEVNHLENTLLELLEYNVTISASLYASYYFELRALCEASSTKDPRPINEAQAQKLELDSQKKTAEWQKQHMKSNQFKSAPNLAVS